MAHAEAFGFFSHAPCEKHLVAFEKRLTRVIADQLVPVNARLDAIQATLAKTEQFQDESSISDPVERAPEALTVSDQDALANVSKITHCRTN